MIITLGQVPLVTKKIITITSQISPFGIDLQKSSQVSVNFVSITSRRAVVTKQLIHTAPTPPLRTGGYLNFLPRQFLPKRLHYSQ